MPNRINRDDMKGLALSLLLMLCLSLAATTRIVDINGTGQYTSIQTAVTACTSGDTVLVYPGRYLENVNISVGNIVIQSLEHATNDPSFIESTVIDGSMLAQGIRINQNVQNITIRGLSITNSKIGISLGQNSISTITNCLIYGNAASNGGGINLFKGTTVLSGVQIYDNYAYIMAGGIYINGYMDTVNVTFDPVNRCSIYNNTAGAGQDIVAHSINNDLSIPLDMFTVANPNSYYAAPYRAYGNEFQLLIDVQRAHHQELNSDLYVSPTGDDSNDGLSPATALKTIRTAVYRVASDSLNQKTVHILPGTYSRTANQQVFPIPLKNWVKVQGAGIGITQIVGEMDPTFANVQYNALKVFTSFYQTHAGLENLSITSAGSNNSCAVWGYQEESLYLKNLRMYDLYPDLCAVIDITHASNALWDNVTVEDIVTEDMGLMFVDGYFTGTIRNSVFRNAISVFMSDEVWASPLIWMGTQGEISFDNCRFDNLEMLDDDSNIMTIGYTAALSHNNRYRLINCLFSNLRSHSRMMIMASEGYPEMDIVNCTFSGNTSDSYILMVNGNINVINSVFQNNCPYEIAINPMLDSGESSTITIDYSMLNGGYSGIRQAPGNVINYLDSNIDADPLFIGGNANNPLYYSLSASSPCIDVGTADTTGLSLLPYDLAGNMRIWNNVIDMGCYEYGAPPVGIDDPTAPQLTEGIYATNYPNPFNPETTMSFFLPEAGVTELCIYNLKGQMIRKLINAPLSVGTHRLVWDGKDDRNSPVASGMYLYRLQSGKHKFSGKMVLAK